MKFYNKIFWLYLFAIVPLLGSVLDLFSVISPLSVDLIGIILKDVPIILLILFSLNTSIKNIKNENILFIFLITIYFLISILWNDKNNTVLTIIAAMRNEILYPCIYLAAYKVGLESKLSEGPPFRIFVISLIINLIMGILQQFNLIDSPYKDLRSLGGGDESFIWIHGGMNSYIEFSFYLSFSIMIIAILINKLLISSILKATIKIVFILFSLELIVASQSRLGLLIYFIAVLGVFIRDRIATFYIVIILLLSFFYYDIFGMQIDLNHRIMDFNGSDPRFDIIYPNAIDLIEKKFIFGYGLGSYGPASIFSEGVYNSIDYIDSSFLSISLQFGLFGLILYILFISINFYRILQKSLQLKKYDIALLNFILALITIIYSIFFNFTNAWPGSILIFCWLGYINIKLKNLLI